MGMLVICPLSSVSASCGHPTNDPPDEPLAGVRRMPRGTYFSASPRKQAAIICQGDGVVAPQVDLPCRGQVSRVRLEVAMERYSTYPAHKFAFQRFYKFWTMPIPCVAVPELSEGALSTRPHVLILLWKHHRVRRLDTHNATPSAVTVRMAV